MKRWWVKLLLGLIAGVLVVLVSVAISGAHSKSAVERYKDQLRAAGEKLDLKDLLPPRVDPTNNGKELLAQAFSAMGPMRGIVSSNPPLVMKMIAPGKAMIGWQQPEIVGDSGSPVTNTWAELDQELQFELPAIELLRQASERSQVDFELDYNQGAMLLLPHLTKMKQTALLLSSATLADLHRGNSASAATNIHTLLVTMNAWKNEPLLISQLVRIAVTQIGATAQWEFLQGTNITDQQLAMLERDWSNLDVVQPMEHAMEMERVWQSRTIGQFRTSNSISGVFYGVSVGGASGGGGGSGDWLDTFKDIGQSMKRKTADELWRVSWSYDDELRSLQGDQVLVESLREAHTNGFFENALAGRDRKIAALGLDHPGANWLRSRIDDDLAGMFGDSGQSLRSTVDRAMNAEVARTLTITAIALKRYQLRHGTSPPDLKAIVPEFLPEVPRDPVDGHALRYQKLTDSTFLLYSIGSDSVDNGGDPSPPPGTKSFQWQRTRDWVWPQAATPQEIEFFRTNPPK